MKLSVALHRMYLSLSLMRLGDPIHRLEDAALSKD